MPSRTLRGFDPREIDVIGMVARYHRQSLPRKNHEGYRDLSRTTRSVVRTLGAFVRLAEGLDRSHAQVVTRLSVAAKENERLVVRLKTKGDAELEIWAADRHAIGITDVFGVPVSFEQAGSARNTKFTRAKLGRN